MRVASLGHSDASSEPLYATAEGFFRRNGLDVKLSALSGGPAIIAAIAGGAIDVGFSNSVSAAQAAERGIPIVVLAPAAEYPSEKPDTLLVKLRGSKIKTGADLNGKTVAVASLQGVLQLSAASWIDQNGGDSKTVHFLELPFTEMTAALKAGRIDAGMLAEPILSAEQSDVEPLGDAYGAIGPQWTLGVFVASKAWVDSEPRPRPPLRASHPRNGALGEYPSCRYRENPRAAIEDRSREVFHDGALAIRRNARRRTPAAAARRSLEIRPAENAVRRGAVGGRRTTTEEIGLLR